jgi:hypothetical protein
VGTPILFSPDNVRNVLVQLPSVAALLPDPAVEGEPSDAFPGVLRKTEREVYRWIANTHYEHLADAVLHLERVHAAGCTFGSLLRTRDREQFVSLTAEVFVADDLLRRGYDVKTVQRSDQVSPDLLVVIDGVDVAVEVYSPRELLAVDAWVRKVSDLLNYLDVKASYASSVDTKLEQQIPPERERLDPWAQRRSSTRQAKRFLRRSPTTSRTRSTRSARSRRTTATALRRFSRPSSSTRSKRHPTLDRDGADRSVTRALAATHPPACSGEPSSAPGGRRNGGKRKVSPASGRVLVVYLMGTQVAEDLAHRAHLSQAEQALEDIDPRDYGLDAIAFVVRALPEGLAAILTVADDTTLTTDQINAMVGSTHTT